MSCRNNDFCLVAGKFECENLKECLLRVNIVRKGYNFGRLYCKA